jgi:hypothetical protein
MTMSKTESTTDARFRTLLKRASFELRLAADLAAFENFDPSLRALIAGARGNLRRALSRVGGPAVGSVGRECENGGEDAGN